MTNCFDDGFLCTGSECDDCKVTGEIDYASTYGITTNEEDELSNLFLHSPLHHFKLISIVFFSLRTYV